MSEEDTGQGKLLYIREEMKKKHATFTSPQKKKRVTLDSGWKNMRAFCSDSDRGARVDPDGCFALHFPVHLTKSLLGE